MVSEHIQQIQQALQDEQIDGWLFYDFRMSNPVAYQVLGLSLEEMYTRRWFYFVPAQGTPTALVSAVEAHVLHTLPGPRVIFRTWQEMEQGLGEMLAQRARIAMEYSPRNAIPYMARVDAGTVELVRSLGAEVVSSADIAQRFVAQLTTAQIESHREAGRRLIAVKDQLFAELSTWLNSPEACDEYRVQQRFIALLQQVGILSPEPPLVAANANASNPHYTPTPESSSPIRRGDLVLFDFWGKLSQPGAIFADYTWMAFAGTADEIPAQQREVFEIVRNARDTGIAFVRERLAAGVRVEGREVDDVVRAVIARAGYDEYFVHRTGHNIGTSDHGNGTNIDNYETRDTRALLPSTCCSIEPGIYLPEFGVRSEVNLLIQENDAEVTGTPAQDAIVPLL